MGRAPCCDKANVKKGPWSPEEDSKLKEYIDKHGTGGNWIALPQKAGLKRCGKSCRLRWLNYLRPNIKHGEFSVEEDRIICSLYANIGSRWSIIAAQLPGRTDNDIKNYWNTKLKKRLSMGMTTIPPNYNHHTRPFQPNNLMTSLLHASSSSLPSSPSTPFSSSSSPPSSYKCSSSNSFYNTLARSFTDPLLFSSTPLSNSTTPSCASILLPPLESFVGTLHQYQVKDQSFITFGGDQASCSSNSDGSHAKELECEYGGANSGEQIVFKNNHNNFYNELVEEKVMLPNGGSGGGANAQNGLWGEINPLDYGLEEIKQLISSTSTGSCCNNFLFDENKTEERVVYY